MPHGKIGIASIYIDMTSARRSGFRISIERYVMKTLNEIQLNVSKTYDYRQGFKNDFTQTRRTTAL